MEYDEKMANVLVTGGAGFIGSHLAGRFVETGHHVRVLDDFSSGLRQNLAHLNEKVDLHEADMCDPQACMKACDDIEFVFHQAAIPSVPKSVEQPRASHDANITGTFNLLDASVRCKVRRFVYAASSSAYGDVDVSPKHEGLKPEPLSPYAVQKLAGEQYAKAFFECYGLETLSLRYFNVFGPRQNPKSQYAAAIAAFVSAILRGQPPTIYGDGEATRDFSYIENSVHANELAMGLAKTSGQAINIACGDKISVNQTIDEINKQLGTDIQARHVAERPGDIKHSCADIRLAKEILGYEPVVSFEEGLMRTIEYYRSIAE